MKPYLLLCLSFVLVFATQDSNTSKINYKILPIVSSNPNSGTSAGVMASVIYSVDKESSPSQSIFATEYSNTNSYHVFALNTMYFDSDKFFSKTFLGYLFNNTEFDNASIDAPISPSKEDPRYDVTIKVAGQQLLYEFYKNIYLGGMVYYVNQTYSPKNQAGADFLKNSGISDSSRGGFGGIAQYDTRSKTEKFFPRHAELISFKVNYSPEVLGSEKSFVTSNLDARVYRVGFNAEDVIATQLYLYAASNNTPDAALAALGSQNVLRGFSIGQYKARNMAALQSEYRYQISGTRFRLTTFGGYANLSGGSSGTAQGSRNDDGNYYSGGVGAHYIIQEKAGVDYRVDLATTNKNGYSIYATINQAF